MPKNLKSLNLPRLTNAEYDEVSEKAAPYIPLDECPTCGASKVLIDGGIYEFQSGDCEEKGYLPCKTQMALYKHYLLANIPVEYMRLDWSEYTGPVEVKKWVKYYLERWDTIKRNGTGLEIFSKQLGVGKTYCITHIAKELIKRGEKVYFIPFPDVIGLYAKDNAERVEERLQTVSLLALDEVIPPISKAQGALFATKFEELIRHRTSFNLPTVMTTNLHPDELQQHYPRPYSLLHAKQIEIQIEGDDARQGSVRARNFEKTRELRVDPIT